MAPITTIVHFQPPAESVDRFFAFWPDRIKDTTRQRPGLIDGVTVSQNNHVEAVRYAGERPSAQEVRAR